MAHVVHPTPQFGFPPAPVNHSPPALGFGFGLSPHPTTTYSPQAQSSFHLPHSLTPQHHPIQQQQQQQQRTVQKRRHEDQDDDLRDESMDRSPTPERRPVKRVAPKRMRVSPGAGQHEPGGSGDKASKENKSSSAAEDGVDVGMLLASLPSPSLLPILTTILTSNPQLKPAILSLIPRPTLETAINTLAQSAKKLRDAYPYSTTPSFSPHSSSTTFGFGNGFRANIPSPSTGSAFGRFSPSSPSHPGGMRDSYVLSRLRPHIQEFVSTAFSYLLYFTYIPSESSLNTLGKDKVVGHPSETFAFLSALNHHLVSQPPLTQSSLTPLLLPRLVQEWMAWVDRVDAHLNRDGGMFGMEVARGWARVLDEYAEAKISGTTPSTEGGLRAVRDKWILKVGWLVGRRPESHAMDDDEEL
ncbi:hypothetical protein BD410DRAFT_834600 [Rickenella mellea]|uniref:Tethering factor for nuclear proteasome STS1 n=1 Tax=Rickenella mellea TaxID=50990 RepID=A0A4Y7QNU4_9AGAM|nr:hypothetical protein BD410DRAFT_834600 [Rickenella mellea]